MGSLSKNTRRLYSAIGLLVAAGGLFALSQFSRQRFNSPLQMSVDLSRVGEYRQRFRQTATPTLQDLELAFTPGWVSRREAEEALDDLQGQIRIHRPDGTVQLESSIDQENIHVPEFGPDSCTVMVFRPVPLGEYDLVLTITSPAMGLSSQSQQLICNYRVCGGDCLPELASQMGCIILALTGLMMLVSAGLDWLVRPLAPASAKS